MNKKIILILLFGIIIFIVIIIGCILIFPKKETNDNNSIELKEEIFKVVDSENKNNVEINDNIKTNVSDKVTGTTKATGVSENDIDGKVYITDVKIQADIEKDTCSFYGILHNDTGIDIKSLFLNFVFYVDKNKIKDGAEYHCSDVKNGSTCEITFNTAVDISNISYYTVDYSVME